MQRVALIVLLASAAPAWAQDQSPAPMPSAMPGMDHGKMDKGQAGQAAGQPAAAEPKPMPGMDHGQMAMPGMDKGPMPPANGAVAEGPPPPAAFEGPLHAPVPGVDPQVMQAAREQMARDMSGGPIAWFMADRFEVRAHKGRDGYLWDGQGFYGGDIDKLWLKSEGEGNFGATVERAEVQALWSHAIGPWFDLQTGLRQDLAGPSRTYAVVGVQGLAPYRFDIDAAAFLSNKGDLTARVSAEIDQRITQRLILQPRAEINLAAQDIPALKIGAGVDRIEAGVRLRYEISRRFAPYIGVEQEWRVGRSATYARAAGDRPSATNWVAGVRFWL